MKKLKTHYRTPLVTKAKQAETNEKLRRNGFGPDVLSLSLGNGTVSHYGARFSFDEPSETWINPRHKRWMAILRAIVLGFPGGRVIDKDLDAALSEVGLKKRKP